MIRQVAFEPANRYNKKENDGRGMAMNILVTGAKGFVGKNLVCSLRNIQQGKDRTRPGLVVDNVYEYDLDTDPALLDEYCACLLYTSRCV